MDFISLFLSIYRSFQALNRFLIIRFLDSFFRFVFYEFFLIFEKNFEKKIDFFS